ncbi:hypothetical protein [Brachyspira hyodysenteriae]|nr:hypothetical protein [Brachyspira hyodysenteriae]MCZ9887404.1 hypothetical protein [Brachyspira hyodysenteriae]
MIFIYNGSTSIREGYKSGISVKNNGLASIVIPNGSIAKKENTATIIKK